MSHDEVLGAALSELRQLCGGIAGVFVVVYFLVMNVMISILHELSSA